MKLFQIILVVSLAVLQSSAFAQTKGAAAEVDNSIHVGKTYALVVGISDYKSDKIPDLRYGEKDALEFIKYLKSASGGTVPDENIIQLIGPEASSANIWQKGFAHFLINKSKIKKDDRLIFYFSGHGGSFNNGQADNAYFFVWDAVSSTDGDANLKISQIKDLIHTFVADGVQVIFVFDACRSADVGVQGGLQTVNNIVEEPKGEILLIATKGGAVAYESNKLQHGVFTFFLLKGLYGEADESKDGEIMGYELENYVKNQVRTFASTEFKGNQLPFLKWGATGELETQSVFKYDNRSGTEAITILDGANDPKKSTAIASAKGGGAKGIPSTSNVLIKQFDQAIRQDHIVSPADNSAYYFYEKIAQSNLDEKTKDECKTKLLAALLSHARTFLNSDFTLANVQVNSLSNGNKSAQPVDPTFYDEPLGALVKYIALCPPEQLNPGAASGVIYFKARKATVSNASKDEKNKILHALNIEIKKYPSKSYLYFARGMLFRTMGLKVEANTSFKTAIHWSPLWSEMNSMIEILDRNEEH